MHAPGRGRGHIDWLAALPFAAIIASVSGAMAGTAIGSATIPFRSAYDFERPQPQGIADYDGSAAPQVPLPDHYPIETPGGRFEVYELSARGLYANRRYAFAEPSFAPADEVSYDQLAFVPANADLDSPAVEAETAASSPSSTPPAVVVTRGTRSSAAALAPNRSADVPAEPPAPLSRSGRDAVPAQ
jgi:hypothetical protein